MNNLYIVIIVCAVVYGGLSIAKFCMTDSTDVSRFRKSGLKVYTDNATGVQYVGAGYNGGVTPRIDKAGDLFYVEGDR